MTRTQIQFPDPLYRRLKEIAERNDWSLAEVIRRASELYVSRFPEEIEERDDWSFPVIGMGGDFLTDPAGVRLEVEAIEERSQ